MADIFDILTSTGNKPFLNIYCNSINSTGVLDGASLSIGEGPATVGLIDFTQLPLIPTPLPGSTILISNSTDNGRLEVNNGTSTHFLSYTDDVAGSEIISPDTFSSVQCLNASSIEFITNTVRRALFDVNGNLTLNGTANPLIMNASLEILRQAASSTLSIVSYTSRSILAFTYSNGSNATPTAVLNNNTLSTIRTGGYTGTAYAGNTASINCIATENWSSTANGTAMAFFTVANTTTALTQRMIIDSRGFVGINVIPASQLHVAGNSGSTLRIVDTNQASGRYLGCLNVNGESQWLDPDTLSRSIGYIYFQSAVGSGTAVPGMVSLHTQYLVNIPTIIGTSVNFSSPSNCRLTYNGLSSKKFTIAINITFCNDDSAADMRSIYFWPYHNGVSIATATTRGFTVSGTNFVNCSCLYNINLVTNDYLELYISNESGAIVTSAAVQIGTIQFTIS